MNYNTVTTSIISVIAAWTLTKEER